MRRQVVLGFKTADKNELGEVIYFGNDNEAAKQAVEDSDLYRFQFFQVDRFLYQKFKEENYVKGDSPSKNRKGKSGSKKSDNDFAVDDKEGQGETDDDLEGDDEGGDDSNADEENDETGEESSLKKSAVKTTAKKATKRATKKANKKVAKKVAKKKLKSEDNDLLS